MRFSKLERVSIICYFGTSVVMNILCDYSLAAYMTDEEVLQGIIYPSISRLLEDPIYHNLQYSCDEYILYSNI